MPRPRKVIAVRHDSPGLGDILQACQMASMWNEQYDEVYLSVPKPILELVTHSMQAYERIKVAEHHPMGLGATETGWFTILTQRGTFVPTGDPILRAPHGTDYLVDTSRFNIGIAWSSHWRDQWQNGKSCGRSTTVGTLIDGLHLSDISLHGLQPDRLDEIKPYLGAHMHYYPFTNFSQTARLMMHMDCVVTVDTVHAHMGGGLGIPTIVLFNDKSGSQYTNRPGTDGWWTSDIGWSDTEPNTTPWYKSMYCVRTRGGESTPEDPNRLADAVQRAAKLILTGTLPPRILI